MFKMFTLFAIKFTNMMLKMFRAGWFLSVLVVLANLLYVYASLPETVVVQEDERVTVDRELLFYIMMISIALLNLLVYFVKSMLPNAENLRTWAHGLVITINVFVIISMQAVNVYNSSEAFDHSIVSIYLIGSLGLIVLWAALWPLYLLIQKIFLKQAV